MIYLKSKCTKMHLSFSTCGLRYIFYYGQLSKWLKIKFSVQLVCTGVIGSGTLCTREIKFIAIVTLYLKNNKVALPCSIQRSAQMMYNMAWHSGTRMHEGLRILKRPSQSLLCFCLHLERRSTKLLEISTKKYLITKKNSLTVEWFMRRENNRWLG